MVPAFTVNVAVGVPAETVTEAGVVRTALLSERLSTTVALVALFKVTVQVLDAPDPNVMGAHAKEESTTGEERLIAAVFEIPLKVAVTVTD